MPNPSRTQAGAYDYVNLLARLCFQATVILIPFRYRFVLLARNFPPVYRDFTDFLLFLSDVSLVLTLLFWGATLAWKPRGLRVGPLLLSLPLAGVLLFSLISTFRSVDAALSAYHFIRMLLLAGFYLYVVNEVRSLNMLVLPVTIQAVVQGIVGTTQSLAQRSVGLQSLGELVLDPAWSGVSIVWAEGVRWLRAYGLSDHPNILGGTLALALLVMLGWYAQAPASRRAPAALFLLMAALTLLLTFSRAAWLGALLGAVLLIALWARYRPARELRHLAVLAAAGGLVLLPFLWRSAPFLSVRLNPAAAAADQVATEYAALSYRRLLAAAANELFAQNALTGVGLGTFPVALLQNDPAFPIDYQPVHVVLFDVAVETGIFGALAYLAGMLLPWMALWLNRRSLRFTPALITASAALLAATVIGFFDYYLWFLPPGRLWQWLVWGFWAASYQDALMENSDA